MNEDKEARRNGVASYRGNDSSGLDEAPRNETSLDGLPSFPGPPTQNPSFLQPAASRTGFLQDSSILSPLERDLIGALAGQRGKAEEYHLQDLVPPSARHQQRRKLTTHTATANTSTTKELQDALDGLPLESKSAYMEALQKAPGLVERESPPHLFLLRENGDVWGAATRLASYWDMRRRIFGGDRAFLPLQLPSEGYNNSSQVALSFEDETLLKSDIISQLPEDKEACSVFYFDRSRFAEEFAASFKAEHLLRCLFFLASVAMENESASTRGIVALCLTNMKESDPPERIDAKPFLDLIDDAFPIKLKSLHLCYLVCKDRVESLRQNTLPLLLHRLKRHDVPHHIHIVGTSAEILVDKLRSHGLTRDGLPVSLGGAWTNPESVARPQHTSSTKQAVPLLPIETLASDTLALQLLGQSSLVPLASILMARAEPRLQSSMFPGTAVGLPLAETPEIQSEGIRRLYEALELIQTDQKAAFLMALQKVPRLVLLESDPLKFLRHDKYNVYSAARRLCDYWTKRCEVFRDRAFLPLTLRGDGALSRCDVETIRSGYLQLLPKERGGKSVVSVHPGYLKDGSRSSRMRMLFYACYVAGENPLSVTDGFDLMIVFRKSDMKNFNSNSREVVDTINRCQPVFVRETHVVKSPVGLGHTLFYDTILPIVRGYFEALKDSTITTHVGDQHELIKKLAFHGFIPSGVPEDAGGSYTLKDHLMWCDGRVQIETSLHGYTIPPPFQDSTATDSSIMASTAETSLPVDQSTLELHLMRVIEDLPDKEKADFLEAKQRCNDLMAKESDLAAFLRICSFDISDAARRLAQYWKVRKTVFGKERAFLPLDQSGDGSLGRREIGILGTAFLMILPHDTSGRSVIFCDGSRLNRCPNETMLRCIFYIFSVAAENRLSQTDGCILVYLINEPSFDRIFKECLDMILSAVPVSIRDAHFVYSVDNSHDRRSADRLDQETFRQVQQMVKGTAILHSDDSRCTAASKLGRYGLTPDGLPKSIGGQFGFDRFVSWQELRTRYEWNLPPAVGTEAEASIFDFSKVVQASDLTEEEKNERKRKLNVIHSRRKRERERMNIEALNEQRLELKSKQKDLLKEQSRLEALLEKAKELP